MNRAEFEKEISKEILKKTIDNSKYIPKIKEDLKHIIDISDTGEQILERILTYFATLN